MTQRSQAAPRAARGNDGDPFRGQVVALTCAGRDPAAVALCQALARVFGEKGARIAVVGVEDPRLRAAVDEVRDLGSEGLLVPGDVADPEVQAAMLAEVEGRWGRLDVVVLGVGDPGDVRALCRVPTARWRATYDRHIHPLGLVRRAAPLMRRSGRGTFVVLVEDAAPPHRQLVHPYPYRTALTAGQAFRLEFARLAAAELAESGLAVLAVNPGAAQGVRGEQAVHPLVSVERGLWGRTIRPEDVKVRRSQGHPAGRYPTPHEIARAIVALTAPDVRLAASGGLVEFGGGRDYRGTPRIAPARLAASPPDLRGRRVLLTGTAAPERLRSLLLGLADAGARVVLGASYARGVVSSLAGPLASLRDGGAVGPAVLPVDLDLRDEAAVRGLFERVLAEPGLGGLDAFVHATGELGVDAPLTGLSEREVLSLKEQFAFVPALVARYACVAVLVEAARREGIADPRFLELSSLVSLLERERGTLGSNGTLERRPGDWATEDEPLLQRAAREARCALVFVGPDTPRSDAASLRRLDVVRAHLQALVSSLAAEVGAVRGRVPTNLVFPGREYEPGDPDHAVRAVLHLLSDAAREVSGMVWYADARNAVAV